MADRKNQRKKEANPKHKWGPLFYVCLGITAGFLAGQSWTEYRSEKSEVDLAMLLEEKTAEILILEKSLHAADSGGDIDDTLTFYHDLPGQSPRPAALDTMNEPAGVRSMPEEPVQARHHLLPEDGGFYLQVGSFRSQPDAMKLKEKLRGPGIPVSVQSVQLASGQWFRVTVGPLPNEPVARKVMRDIRQQHHLEPLLKQKLS